MEREGCQKKIEEVGVEAVCGGIASVTVSRGVCEEGRGHIVQVGQLLKVSDRGKLRLRVHHVWSRSVEVAAEKDRAGRSPPKAHEAASASRREEPGKTTKTITE